eukprot:361710-Heterocapsa_arctica.AAC.1
MTEVVDIPPAVIVPPAKAPAPVPDEGGDRFRGREPDHTELAASCCGPASGDHRGCCVYGYYSH